MTTMTATRTAVSVTGLQKSFGDKVVLDDIDLTVAEGTIFALLGPNGAGKTTMVHILSTLIGADGGEMSVAGHDLAAEPDAVRAAIGLTGQFSAVDNLLTGQENLVLMADLHHLGHAEGRRRAAALLDRFGLADVAKKPAATYSGGMRRRLDLAMTLVGDPRLIFLDEPTTGLDPRARRDVWQIIRGLAAGGVTIFLTTQYLDEADHLADRIAVLDPRARRDVWQIIRGLAAGGVTIFLTTQYLDEADHLADRIAVLDQGRIVAEGRPEQLKRRIPGGHIQLQFAGPGDLESAAEALGAASRDDEALTLQVPSDGSLRSLRALLDRLDYAGIDVGSLSIHTPDLDDVFFALTGHPSTEKEAQQ